MKIEVSLEWGPQNQEEDTGSANRKSQPNESCLCIEGRRGDSVQLIGELVLRTLEQFLRLLGSCSPSVNLSVCPLLINHIPPISDKSGAGELSD